MNCLRNLKKYIYIALKFYNYIEKFVNASGKQRINMYNILVNIISKWSKKKIIKSCRSTKIVSPTTILISYHNPCSLILLQQLKVYSTWMTWIFDSLKCCIRYTVTWACVYFSGIFNNKVSQNLAPKKICILCLQSINIFRLVIITISVI